LRPLALEISQPLLLRPAVELRGELERGVGLAGVEHTDLAGQRGLALQHSAAQRALGQQDLPVGPHRQRLVARREVLQELAVDVPGAADLVVMARALAAGPVDGGDQLGGV
jgi:hypothetical protein